MSYAEAKRLHDTRALRDQAGGGDRGELLRTILPIVLDPETAAWCLGRSCSPVTPRWPSSLYRTVAGTAVKSPEVWRRCALLLDRTLHQAVLSYGDRPAAELAELFHEGRESLGGAELAALLWCLIRRRSASDDLVAQRLSLELELVAARRLHACAR